MNEFRLPDLGEGLQEAELIEWHVQPGDRVLLDQPLVTVETAKALVDIPSPRAGVVEACDFREGEAVPVGAVLLRFVAEPSSAHVTPVAVAAASHTVVGVMEQHQGEALAEEQFMVGSPYPPLSETESPAAPVPAVGTPVSGEPLHGLRRQMAENLHQAHQQVAQVTLFEAWDITAWSRPWSVLSRVVEALVEACRAEPGLNAWYGHNPPSRQLCKTVDVGIAVDLPDGLLVPVLRQAQTLDRQCLTQTMGRLISQARARQLPPTAFREATILLSNYGTLAGRFGTPQVVPPMVAIVGVGRVFEQPQRVGRRWQSCPQLPISLSVDHRAVTGGEAGRFLQVLGTALMRP